MTEMKVIDGAHGEGGGQILRSSLSISAVTGQPIEVHSIRAGRGKPGLLRQHLTAVQAVAEVCGAQVQGDALKSQRITFVPGPIRAGEYAFSIGSAGSANLVLQTVLPVLLAADGPSTVTVEGGTHNQSSPPFDFLERVFFPILRKMGAGVQAKLLRPGFFPAGGGQIQVELVPPSSGKLGPIEITERGALKERRVQALVANLSPKIGQRELAAFSRRVPWPAECQTVQMEPGARGPGNVFISELHYEHVSAMFTSFGTRGVPAERVATICAGQVLKYIASDVPVCEHLADQLLLPMALGAGGSFVTQALSMHSQTNIEVIRQLLGVSFDVSALKSGILVTRSSVPS